MIAQLDQPGAREPLRLLGSPVKLSRTPADGNRRPGPALGEHTMEVLHDAGFGDEEIEVLVRSGAAAGPSSRVEGTFRA
jgi:crotonobetainyl-CoA:carnitine CoA-transferase CaiB-like acyl-CoA transferase